MFRRILFILISVTSVFNVQSNECQTIDGFQCFCSSEHLRCVDNGHFPSALQIDDNQRERYQTVELIIKNNDDIQLNDRTFESIRSLFRRTSESLEFRIQFEQFSSLRFSSNVFNRVFPNDESSKTRTNLVLNIFNNDVRPNFDGNLFQNLNVDSLQFNSIFSPHQSFQQLFSESKIQSLRLAGQTIRSDLSQNFTGVIGRLEFVTNAKSLSADEIPVYPAHEMAIKALHLTDLESDHLPNYQNVIELDIYTSKRISANAFRDFPNLRVLSIQTDKFIDSQAFDGLDDLETLIVHGTKLSLHHLSKLLKLKQIRLDIHRLDRKSQCQLMKKVDMGIIHVESNSHQCTCITAYLDAMAHRSSCHAENCHRHHCETIRYYFERPSENLIQHIDEPEEKPRRIYSKTYQIPDEDRNGNEMPFNSEGPADDDSNEEKIQRKQREIDDSSATSPIETEAITKERDSMSFLPLIVIAAAVIGLLVMGAAYMMLRRKRVSASASTKTGYQAAATTEEITVEA